MPIQIFSHDGLHLTTTMSVTVYSNNLEQISVHLLTDIHDSGTQQGVGGGVCPFTRHLIGDEKKEKGGFWVNVRGQSQEDSVLNTTQLTVWRPG